MLKDFARTGILSVASMPRLLLRAGLLLAACAVLSGFASTPAQAVKVMCIGDSITAGNNSPSWRWEFFQRLAWGGYAANVQFVGPYTGGSNPSDSVPNPEDGQVVNGQTFHSQHAAVWGISSGTLASGWETTDVGYDPDIAIIHLGTNDGYIDSSTTDQYQRVTWNYQTTLNNYATIIADLRAENPHIVILLSEIIPRVFDYSFAPGLNAQIPAFAAQNTQAGSPIIVVDNYDGYDPFRMNQPDGTHPATDGEDFMAQNFFNAIVPYLPAPSGSYADYPVLTAPLYAHGTVGQPFYFQLGTTNPATSFTAAGLPAGLTLNASTGLISGTPTAPTAPAPPTSGPADTVRPDPVAVTATNGTYTYPPSATAPSGTYPPEMINFAIEAPYPNKNTPSAVPGTIYFDNYDQGGLYGSYYAYDSNQPYFPANDPNFAYYGNFNGPYRYDDVDMDTCADTVNNGYSIRATGSNQWTNYTVSVATTGVYQMQVRESCPGSGGFIHALVDGYDISYNGVSGGNSLLNQFVLPSTGSWNTYTTATAPLPVDLSAGTHTLQVWQDSAGMDLNWMNFAYVSAGSFPVISVPTLLSATAGSPFSYTISASNNPTSYSIIGCPWVTVTGNVLSGTPPSAETYTGTITATNGSGTGYAPITINVTKVTSTVPIITSATSASGTVGTAFSYSITATNSPTSFAATGLPAGLSVSTSTGRITGTPTAAGTSSVSLGASNSSGTGTATLTLTVGASTPPAPVISSAATASGTVGTAFSYQITASNSPTSYAASSLPPGVTVNTASGLISGTPTTAGTYTSSVSATNAGGTGSKTVTVTISTAGGSAYNINAIFTLGTDVANGGADSYGNAYVSSLIGSSASFNGSSFTFGPANAPDAYSNMTVTLPSGTYTTLNMLATGVGGVQNSQTFVVHYTDNTTSNFTQNMSDWSNPQNFSGETKVVTMADEIGTNGQETATTVYLYGYTFALDGKSVQSITLPANRGVIALGFAAKTGTAAPVITSALTSSGTVGTAFSYQITASNTPTSYAASGLPAGLSANTTTGAITGTPTASGSFPVTISATNSGGTGSATLTLTIGASSGGYGVDAIFTLGTTVTNGGADTDSNAYEASLIGASASFNGTTFTFGPVNAPDAYSNETVALPAGTYTTLYMLATAVGGNQTSQTFTVHYTDGTTSTFTQSLSDWTNPQSYPGETKVVTMANRLSSNGSVATPACYVYGYVFALNGKSVQSITLPATRDVIAFGFQPAAYNVHAIFTNGTDVTNGGADSYGNAYVSSLIGTSASFNGSSFTFGPANAPDAYTSETVALPAGTYTTLNMLATGVGGVQNSQTFVVHYTDGTTSNFTQNMSDWTNPQNFSGETKVITMADEIGTNGQETATTNYLYGYTFTLNGKAVQSITLPSNRGVIALGFGGH